MAFAVRKPYAFLIVSFALLFRLEMFLDKPVEADSFIAKVQQLVGK